MNRRKLVFIALAIALPLALIIPLRAARSWQPRAAKLAYRTAFLVSNKDLTGLFWRDNGLFLTRNQVPLERAPLHLRNWNGREVALRAAKADQVALDEKGVTAALVYVHSARLQHDLWDVEAAKSRGVIESLALAERHQHNLYNAFQWVISPDGRRVAWDVTADNCIKLGRASDAKSDAIYRFTAPNVSSSPHRVLAFSPDSRELAVVSPDALRIVDARTGLKHRQWNLVSWPNFSDAQWSHDGKMLALWWGHSAQVAAVTAPHTNAYLRVFDAQTGAILRSWSQTKAFIEPQGVTNVSFAPDGKRLAFGTYDGDALLMNLQSGAIERHFPVAGAANLKAPAHYVAIAPAGDSLAVAVQNAITLWRIR